MVCQPTQLIGGVYIFPSIRIVRHLKWDVISFLFVRTLTQKEFSEARGTSEATVLGCRQSLYAEPDDCHVLNTGVMLTGASQ